jgi:hypothetical protein
MENGSLDKLKAAFGKWRSKKRHRGERIPTGLLERACTAARHHGSSAVARATKLDQRHLKTGRRMNRGGTRTPAARVPAFSRIELAGPAATTRPFAEVEMPTGLKVRLFEQTDAILGLLTSVFGPGGAK